MKTLFAIFLILWMSILTTVAQNDSLNKKLNFRQKLIITTISLQQIGSFYIEYNWWWKDNYHPFNVKNDGWFNNYSYGIDKVGHFYISYLYYQVLNEVMNYGGFSKKSTNVTSVLLPSLWALSIEFGDGYSRYAFNPDDLVANFLGIAYGFAQNNLSSLKPYTFKMSYYPSYKYFDNNFKGWVLSDDYDGHIYWLTSNLHLISPEKFKSNFFKFLNLGFGYGISGYSTHFIRREFFISLDYNLSAINTKDKKSLSAIKSIADKWHYPAPGFKFEESNSSNFRILILN